MEIAIVFVVLLVGVILLFSGLFWKLVGYSFLLGLLALCAYCIVGVVDTSVFESSQHEVIDEESISPEPVIRIIVDEHSLELEKKHGFR